MLNRDLDRERAVVEAKMWGEKIKEQKKGNPEKQKKREHTEKNRDKLKQKTQKTNVNVTVFLIASCKSEKEEPKQKAVTFIITETKGKQKGKSYADESKTTALQASSPSPEAGKPFSSIHCCFKLFSCKNYLRTVDAHVKLLHAFI
jgi:hypothetical protein